MKVKSACWSGPPVGSWRWARVTDVAKRRRQGLVVCRAALPFEGCCDARPGVALAPATVPIGRVVGPRGTAALAVHLMINTAITGATIDIDGGQQLVG